MPFAPESSYLYLNKLFFRKRFHNFEKSNKKFDEKSINEVINEAIAVVQPPTDKGKRLKIYFSHQTGINPPKFTFRVNNKRLVHFSYERYLENKIRENFDFTGGRPHGPVRLSEGASLRDYGTAPHEGAARTPLPLPLGGLRPAPHQLFDFASNDASGRDPMPEKRKTHPVPDVRCRSGNDPRKRIGPMEQVAKSPAAVQTTAVGVKQNVFPSHFA